MNPEMVIMLIAVFIAYFLSATFGFGDALILLPIFSLFIDIEVAVIFTGFWSFPQSIQQLVKYHKFTEKKFLIYFLPSIIPGIFLGIFLILYVPSIWIQFLVGILILVYVGYKSIKEWKKSKEIKLMEIDEKDSNVDEHNHNKTETGSSRLYRNSLEKTLSYPSLILGGFLYGTASSWVGTPGPISIIYLDVSGFMREKFIANSNAIILIAGVFKLSIYLINGMFPVDYIWLFFGGLVLCLVAITMASQE